MIKSSNKKHFKKDIHILEIQGNSKYCKQHGDSNCEDCYIFSPICINKEILQNINYRNRISCHIFLLGKRGPIRHLILQEDPNVSNLCPVFYFGLVGLYMEIISKPPSLPPPPKKKVSILFLPKFNWQYGISKIVSLSIRRYRELNLCRFFDFGNNGPNYWK